MIGSYISLIFILTLVLGAVFQAPLIMYCLVRWQVVTAEQVQSHRKSAILAGFILAAVLTPPDPLTQIMMALPLIILYDLGALAAAPSRRTLLNFGRFAGTLAVIGGIIAAIFFLWPVGYVTVEKGALRIGSRELSGGQQASLRRGQICVVPAGSLARIRFGRRATAPSLLVADNARVQVHGGGRASLYSGRALADNTGSRSPMEVRAVAARVTLQTGKAEFVVPETNTLTVNVISGEVMAHADAQQTRISAGRSATFHFGGEPLDTGSIEKRWRQLMTGETERTE